MSPGDPAITPFYKLEVKSWRPPAPSLLFKVQSGAKKVPNPPYN
jgi:hypothetical protein